MHDKDPTGLSSDQADVVRERQPAADLLGTEVSGFRFH